MSKHPVTVPAPAKINLFLHVVGRRGDGYHLLESVFVPIALADFITLTVTDDGAIVRESELPGVPPEKDLMVRAARLLQESTGVSCGVRLSIRKNIPMGGGLGGGSSDAASVLLALNRLWNLALPRAELARLGLKLGADVPFFIGGEPAFVSGVGEILRPVSLPPTWVALALPPVAVPTAEIFSSEQLTRNTLSERIAAFATAHGHNDLEPVARQRYPLIGQTIGCLQRYNSKARMSGSGASVFALFDSEDETRQAIRDLPGGVAGLITCTLAAHPLIKWSFRETG